MSSQANSSQHVINSVPSVKNEQVSQQTVNSDPQDSFVWRAFLLSKNIPLRSLNGWKGV